MQHAPPGQPLDPQQLGARRNLALGKMLGEVAPHHHADEFAHRGGGDLAGANDAAIAQH